MSRARPPRETLLAALDAAMRRSSAQSVLMSEAVAERLGIGSSDLECLDLLNLREVATAGELAEATGLTSGAITGVVDRLERAGLARRERSTADRRKVLVRPRPAARRRIAPLFQPLARAMTALSSRYSEDELRLLVDFATRMHAALVAETARLRAAGPRRSRRAESPRRRGR